jgi:NDP-sugar pyrophosphorylase family protein
MKAIILAAGYGTRLGTLTKSRPKPTLPLGGRPIIERVVERLYAFGIDQIIVNLHYLPAIMTTTLQDRALYFYEPALLGHFGTINALKGWLEDDDFFVINGDTISNVNYEDMTQMLKPDTIVALMDEWRSAGTWLYSNTFFDEKIKTIIPYRPHSLVWHDIGTPERLAAAQKYYGKKI